jgi:hypothetical protein
VPPAPPQNNPAILPTSSLSTAQGQFPGAPGKPPIRLQTKQFLPAAELQRMDVTRIADLPPLRDIPYDEYDSDYESDDLSN